MVGYLNDITRILNEWQKLFMQKHHVLSDQDNKNWKYIKNFDIPHFKKNTWKYNLLKKFLTYNFVSNENTILDISKYQDLILPIDSHRLIFVNGKFSKKLSDATINPWIIHINNNIPNQYKTLKPIQPDIFSYLTEYLSNATIYINLPQGNTTNKPLYLLYINTGLNIKNKLTTSHYHHYINIENNTNTSIVEHFISINKHKYFSGIRTSINLEKNSELHHIRLMFENHLSYHTSHHDINIGHSSHVNSNTFFILGPKFIYHKTNAKLNHEKSSLLLNSFMFLKNKDVGNIRTYLEHNNHDYALSRQLHKIIACNDSIGNFDGLIKVNANSIKTDGKMTNNNLLLHKNAIICSTPKLEIYSDNVQCGHGATIGQINANHLFYLMTRGIPEKDALKILIYAFAIETTENIQNTLLKNIILRKIDQTLTRSLYENLSYQKN